MEINGLQLCIGCMKTLNQENVCSHCHLDQREYKSIPRCLIPGTKLQDRYVLGKVLGEGSFGITYIGWDSLLAIPVTIKEYYPSDLVSRDVSGGNNRDVYVYENDNNKEYKERLNKFLNEARILTRFNYLNGIVSVRDFFYENHTAYIIMDYVEGASLKEYVKKYGKLSGTQVLVLMKPVLSAMAKIHEAGFIHRDISPDNILVNQEGQLVVIDFGAARVSNLEMTKSITVVFKRGFSPEEQYRSKGKQGAYSDIYSLCATMYYMLTEQVIDESVQRMIEDKVVPLWEYPKIELTQRQMEGIMKGMNVKAQDRFQNLKDLYSLLYEEDVFATINVWENKSPIRKNKWQGTAIMAIIATIFLCIGGILFYRSNEMNNERTQDSLMIEETKQQATTQITTQAIKQKPQYMISVLNLTKDEALSQFQTISGATFIIEWEKSYNTEVPKGQISEQSIEKGTLLQPEEMYHLTLTVSEGEKKEQTKERDNISNSATTQSEDVKQNNSNTSLEDEFDAVID